MCVSLYVHVQRHATCMYMPRVPLHYSAVPCIAWTTLNYSAARAQYSTWQYFVLHCIITSRTYITSHRIHTYTQMHCMTLGCLALDCIAVHNIALIHACIALVYVHYIPLQYLSLHYIALHFVTTHYIKRSCITLHFITTYVHACIHTHMQAYIHIYNMYTYIPTHTRIAHIHAARACTHTYLHTYVHTYVHSLKTKEWLCIRLRMLEVRSLLAKQELDAHLSRHPWCNQAPHSTSIEWIFTVSNTKTQNNDHWHAAWSRVTCTEC